MAASITKLLALKRILVVRCIYSDTCPSYLVWYNDRQKLRF